MVGTPLRVLFLVTRWCDLGAFITLRGAVGYVVVVTGGAVTALWVAAGSTLCGGVGIGKVAKSLAVLVSALARFRPDVLFIRSIESMNSLCTSSA